MYIYNVHTTYIIIFIIIYVFTIKEHAAIGKKYTRLNTRVWTPGLMQNGKEQKNKDKNKKEKQFKSQCFEIYIDNI